VLAPDPALEQRFAAWAEERLASLPNLALTSAQVSRLIIQGLDDPKLSLRSVARELAMSPRSLQAQLAAEGSEFSLLLRQAREQLARQYLKENHTVEDITCWLGFAEPSVFRKAFKKWSGMTPAEYRRIG
jgi:AraC-like DNA-binding protein